MKVMQAQYRSAPMTLPLFRVESSLPDADLCIRADKWPDIGGQSPGGARPDRPRERYARYLVGLTSMTLVTGRKIRRFEGNGLPDGLALSPDGRVLAGAELITKGNPS